MEGIPICQCENNHNGRTHPLICPTDRTSDPNHEQFCVCIDCNEHPIGHCIFNQADLPPDYQWIDEFCECQCNCRKRKEQQQAQH